MLNKILKSIAVLIGAIISGILYRMGGAAGYNTKFRDFGCPTVMVIVLACLGMFHWTLILVFGLSFASLTTYFKKKGTEAKWYNWMLVGLTDGLSVLPLCFVYPIWRGFAWRILACTVTTTLCSCIIGNDVVEEVGRGIIRVMTLPLLLIP